MKGVLQIVPDGTAPRGFRKTLMVAAADDRTPALNDPTHRRQVNAPNATLLTTMDMDAAALLLFAQCMP
jgi:hypothetical protein